MLRYIYIYIYPLIEAIHFNTGFELDGFGLTELRGLKWERRLRTMRNTQHISTWAACMQVILFMPFH